jgi:tight adherence protein C
MEFLLLSLVFLFGFGLTLGGHLYFARRRRELAARLDKVGEADELAPSTPLLGDLTPALAAQVPVADDDRDALRRELRVAGFYRPNALEEYAALRALLVLLPLLTAGAFALFAETLYQGLWAWGLGILAAVLGYSLPRVWVHYRGKRRSWQIERGMPVAIDMLTLCLGAGLNVLNSLERVVAELHLPFPVLAYELEIVRKQSELRTLEFALAQFADRVGLPHARNLAVILTQSENLGTDAVGTLREYADNMRVNMKQRAEERANAAPFKLLFPAYLLAIGAAILLISPTVLEFTAFRRDNLIGTNIREARGALEAPTQPRP